MSNTGCMHASVTGKNSQSLISLQIYTLSCNCAVPRCLPGHQFWVIYGHANEGVCLRGRRVAFAPWVREQRMDTAGLWVSPELLTQAPSWQRVAHQDGEMAFTGLHADWWDQGETRPSWTSVRQTDTERKRQTLPNHRQRGGRGYGWGVLGLSSICPNLFVERITYTCWYLEHSGPKEAGFRGWKQSSQSSLSVLK